MATEIFKHFDAATLVGLALGGSQEAFSELARRYRGAAFGVAFHCLGEADAARDAAQQALISAYIELPMLRDHAKFAPWLCRIAAAAARNEVHYRQRSLPLGPAQITALAQDPQQSAAAFESAEKSRCVRQALAMLPEGDRLPVLLHYLGGYSHEEISAMLGTTVPGIKSRIHRSRRRLKEEMMETMRAHLRQEVPALEFTEELVRRVLRRPSKQMAILDKIGPERLEYTLETRQAIARLASELAQEECDWLVAPPHIPDGSPALSVLQEMGFTVETELHWYERSLKGKLPVFAPEPGTEIRFLLDTDPAEVLAFLRATVQQHAPDAISVDTVRGLLNEPFLVRDASLGSWRDSKLTAIVSVYGVDQPNVKFDKGTAVFWWTAYDPQTGGPQSLVSLIKTALGGLKALGFRLAVREQIRVHNGDEDLIPILKAAGLRYIRSQWNLKLALGRNVAGVV